jgi:uncharacterized protein (DUF305 family)
MKARTRSLIAGLAAAFLLVAGAGAVFAAGQMRSMMSDGGTNSMMGGDDMGSMMDGGDMGSMMGDGGGIGSMMSGGMMGSFDEDEPFDLQFIDQMIMHHSGAIMSSEMMIADSERPELRELAANIEESQTEQIETMKDMRERWYPDAEGASGMMGGDMDSMMGDGMMESMMGGSMRESMGANATDEMFLRMMIPHHQMAVDMSEKALEESERPELRELARTIKEEQSAEIELMRGYLEEIEASTEG